MTKTTTENEASTTRTLPLWKNVLKEMQDAGLITHGGTVLWAWLESRFKSDHESWAFRKEWFPLRDAIIRTGYMITEDGCNGTGFRIREREEMADAANRHLHNFCNGVSRNAISLGSVNTAGMDDREAKRIEFMSIKCARIYFDTKETMAKRKNIEPLPNKKLLEI